MTAYPPRDFIVRPIDPDADGPALHAIFGDEASCRYLTRPATQCVADTVAMMREWMGDGGDINWVVADTPDGPALGRVAIYPRGKNNVWDAACMIAPAARGRNLAVRALAIALVEAFDTLGARRIARELSRRLNLAPLRPGRHRSAHLPRLQGLPDSHTPECTFVRGPVLRTTGHTL
jgi:GNAT superfamily N-acetyltransferase